jgi:hypothetical protein
VKSRRSKTGMSGIGPCGGGTSPWETTTDDTSDESHCHKIIINTYLNFSFVVSNVAYSHNGDKNANTPLLCSRYLRASGHRLITTTIHSMRDAFNRRRLSCLDRKQSPNALG